MRRDGGKLRKTAQGNHIGLMPIPMPELILTEPGAPAPGGTYTHWPSADGIMDVCGAGIICAWSTGIICIIGCPIAACAGTAYAGTSIIAVCMGAAVCIAGTVGMISGGTGAKASPVYGGGTRG